VPVNVLDRLADDNQVVAIKLMTTLDEAITFELCERVSERILIGCVNLKLFPMLSKHYGAQWSGAWTAEALQSPEKPYVADYVRQLNAGDYAAALQTYHRILPAYQALFAMMAPVLPLGIHPFTQLKYYQWFVGGNGGLLRPSHDPRERDFKLTAQQRDHIAQAYQQIGIHMSDPADSYIVGRALHADGKRAEDYDVSAREMFVP